MFIKLLLVVGGQAFMATLADNLHLFLRLGRWLFWLVRWLRWALFKDNLSFPGNVRVGDLLSKLLQIEFNIGDSLFQGFVFVWHMFVPIRIGLLLGSGFALAR
jgi:hypothetical protein